MHRRPYHLDHCVELGQELSHGQSLPHQVCAIARRSRRARLTCSRVPSCSIQIQLSSKIEHLACSLLCQDDAAPIAPLIGESFWRHQPSRPTKGARNPSGAFRPGARAGSCPFPRRKQFSRTERSWTLYRIHGEERSASLRARVSHHLRS